METTGNDQPDPNDDVVTPPVPPLTPPSDPVPTSPRSGAVPPTAPTLPPTPPPRPAQPPSPPPRPEPSGAAGHTAGGAAHKALDEVETIFEGGLEGEWPARAADAIVNVVGVVRDNTTGRITTIARGLVFGLFAAVLGLTVAVLLIIAAIRLLDEALPSGVWLAYLVLSVVMLVAGALVFRKRNQPAPPNGNTGPA